PGTINVIQAKIFSEQKMIRIAAASFLIAMISGLIAVVYRQAWALIPVGGVSMLAGIFYTAGPRPAAYLGLGETLVIVFFGPVTVAGTYFIQALTFSTPVIWAGLACGLICSGILIINNYRDYDNDLRCNKRTLPVRLGRSFAKWEYLTMWVIASLIPFIIFRLTGKPGVLLGSLTGLAAIPLIQTVLRTTESAALNQALANNGKLLVLFSLLFSFGWLIPLP
ncbi:MAG TPA: 1,4-dihydroxy-2-naphthoate octaprenyltransferase, partial [Candidatus Bathyarchaeia archaeon]|nr:1,4-dihydroxy-2-naphthoate octaprenyltransferase [Candidatus Bathyarchaeia archaeon]